MPTFLDFEKPIAELEGKIEELRHLTDAGGIDIAEEVGGCGTRPTGCCGRPMPS